MLRSALAAAALVVSLPLVAQELPTDTWGERFRWSGEEFYYSIEMLGSEAARCAVAVGPPIEHPEHGMVVPLEGLAASVGFFANVYEMHDTAETFVSVDSGLPVYSTKVIDERGRVRTYDVGFEHAEFDADVVRTASTTRRTRRNVPSDTHDALSWMIDLRSRDLSVGAEYAYHVFDGWKLSRLSARVRSHTEIYTELGMLEVAEIGFTREVLGSFSPLPYAESASLPPVYTVSDGPTELGVGWFSLDDRRLPVGVEIETPIGHLRMLIDRHVPPS